MYCQTDSFESLESWNCDNAKKQKIDRSPVGTICQERKIYQPIASLTRTQCCPLIRGTIASTSDWRMTSRGTRYSNFVLEDESGRIEGVIFRAKDWEFEKKFVVGARLTVADAVVKPVNPSYRKDSNHLYELSISNECRTVKFEDPTIEDKKTISKIFDPKVSMKDLMHDVRAGEFVSIVGLVISCEPETFQKSSLGYVECRKKLTLRDVEDSQIDVVVRGRASSRYEFPMNSVVVVKNAIVNVEGMKITLTVDWTDFHLAPPSPEMQEIERILKPSVDLVAPLPVAPPKPISQNSTPVCATEIEEVKKKGKEISIVERRLDRPVPSTSDPSLESNFVRIDVIHDRLSPGTIIDVLAVVSCRLDPQQIKCCNGMKSKMSVELADESGQTIWMVVWGPHVEKIDKRPNMIIAAKRVQVRCWKNMKELNCTDLMSSLVIEPEIEQVKVLREWLRCNVVEEGTEDDGEEFRRSVRIADFQNGQKISFLGIITNLGEAKIVKAKYINDYARTIQVIDSSEKTIHLSLWGELARNFEIPIETVIYATDVKISRSENIKGAMTWNSRFEIQPAAFAVEIEILQRWFAGYKNLEAWSKSNLESANICPTLEIPKNQKN